MNCVALCLCTTLIEIVFSITSFAQYLNLWSEKLFLADSVYFSPALIRLDGSIIGGSGRAFVTTKKFVTHDFFKNLDTSINWQHAARNNFGTNLITDASGNLWVGNADSRISKSTDGGDTWAVHSDFVASYGLGGALNKIRIGKDGVLYVLYNASDIMRSTDKGKTWDYVDHPPGGEIWCDLHVNSIGDLFLLIFRGTENSFLYRSTNSGVSWSRLDTLLQVPRVYGVFEPNLEAARLELINDAPYLWLLHETRNVGLEKGKRWSYMFRPRTDWTGMDTLCEESLKFTTTLVDSMGKWYAYLNDNRSPNTRLEEGLGISTNQGKDWQIFTGIRKYKDVSPHDTIDKFTGDTMQTVYGQGADPLWLMPNGHILYCSSMWGYNISNFRIPTPPMAMGIERACSTYTATFVSDTLLSVEVTEAQPLWSIDVHIDTLRKGVSHRVVITSRTPDTTLHFTIAARGAMGTTIYKDSLVKHYTPTYRVSSDTLYVDAGDKACYRWMRNDSVLQWYIQPYLKMTLPGDYWCEVFDSTSCAHKRIGFTHYGGTDVGEESADTRTLQIIPNPAQDFVTLAYANLSGSTLEIVDVLGKIVQRKSFMGGVIVESTTLDTSRLPDGVYTMRVTNANTIVQKSFVLMRQ